MSQARAVSSPPARAQPFTAPIGQTAEGQPVGPSARFSDDEAGGTAPDQALDAQAGAEEVARFQPAPTSRAGAGAEARGSPVGETRANYSSQLLTVSPASITQVSVLSPPSTLSLPETLSRDFRKSAAADHVVASRPPASSDPAFVQMTSACLDGGRSAEPSHHSGGGRVGRAGLEPATDGL